MGVSVSSISQEMPDESNTSQWMSFGEEKPRAIGHDEPAWAENCRSFFGVRRRRDYESDAARITPVRAIVPGLIGVAVLITILLLLVKAITK